MGWARSAVNVPRTELGPKTALRTLNFSFWPVHVVAWAQVTPIWSHWPSLLVFAVPTPSYHLQTAQQFFPTVQSFNLAGLFRWFFLWFLGILDILFILFWFNFRVFRVVYPFWEWLSFIFLWLALIWLILLLDLRFSLLAWFRGFVLDWIILWWPFYVEWELICGFGKFT